MWDLSIYKAKKQGVWRIMISLMIGHLISANRIATFALCFVFIGSQTPAQEVDPRQAGVVAALNSCALHFASGFDIRAFKEWEALRPLGPTCNGCTGHYGKYRDRATGYLIDVTTSDLDDDQIQTLWKCASPLDYRYLELPDVSFIAEWLNGAISVGLIKELDNVNENTGPYSEDYLICNGAGDGALFSATGLLKGTPWFEMEILSKRRPSGDRWSAEGCAS